VELPFSEAPLLYSSTALLLPVNHIETMAPCAPLTYLSSEKKMFRYTAVRINKNFRNQSSHNKNDRQFPLGIEAIIYLPQN